MSRPLQFAARLLAQRGALVEATPGSVEFRAGMERRFARDRERLEGYFDDLVSNRSFPRARTRGPRRPGA